LLPAASYSLVFVPDAANVDVDIEADIDAVACPGYPPAPALASFAFDDCKDMLAGEDCEAECAAGHDGIVTATCQPDGSFAVAGSCQPSQEDDRQGEDCAEAHKQCGKR
jgi:hypothetical protein